MPYIAKKNKDGSHTVYKKDTGEKVGTTHGDVEKYLTALRIHAHEGDNMSYLDQLKSMAKSNRKTIVESKPELLNESEYHDFFKASLVKFGVKSPMQLDESKRKEFYTYISNTWKKMKATKKGN